MAHRPILEMHTRPVLSHGKIVEVTSLRERPVEITTTPEDVMRLALDYCVHLLSTHAHAMGEFANSVDCCNLHAICQLARGEGSGDVPADVLIEYVRNKLGAEIHLCDD